MKSITREEAVQYLRPIGLDLGDWNQVIAKNGELSWLKYVPPQNARELLNFSRHIVGWLPKGDWKIVQLDNSAMLDPIETQLVSTLVGNPGRVDLDRDRAILANARDDLLVAHLVFLLLLFESHAYVISSASTLGEALAIQDGDVHFGSQEIGKSGVDLVLKRYEREPLAPPRWIVELISSGQSASS